MREQGTVSSLVGEAYRTYGYLIHRRCRVLLANDSDADEVLQEVFLRLLKYPTGYLQSRGKLQWLYRVADNACFDRMRALRKRQREVTSAEDVASSDELRQWDQHGMSAEQVLICRQLCERFLSRFDQRIWRLVVYCYIDEMPQEVIARRLGWSRKTISKKLARIKELAQKWQQRGRES